MIDTDPPKLWSWPT